MAANIERLMQQLPEAYSRGGRVISQIAKIFAREGELPYEMPQPANKSLGFESEVLSLNVASKNVWELFKEQTTDEASRNKIQDNVDLELAWRSAIQESPGLAEQIQRFQENIASIPTQKYFQFDVLKGDFKARIFLNRLLQAREAKLPLFPSRPLQINFREESAEIISTTEKYYGKEGWDKPKIGERLVKLYLAGLLKDSPQLEPLTFTPLSELGLSSRVYNVLVRGGIKSIEELLQIPEEELANFRTMGTKSRVEIIEKLASYQGQNK